MATKVELLVLLKEAGIKPTTKNLKALNKQLTMTKKESRQVSKSSNEMKRNLEGVSQRAGSTGKDFSRMAQGMGGLVAVYATVAANVFAMSAAFLVLRRAADLSSMVKSAENFSSRFGVSVTRITMLMQKASGGALSFAEALPTINKAISAGIGIKQMEELTIAATKAAQTFGGSATEALSRFISASQRGRVEIIQTLGVVIKTEAAYKEYAARIGKTALELTAFDRQQAILNATIAESQKIFAGVIIDPNPFQQLLTTITDLKDDLLTGFTDWATPLIEGFNKSRNAAGALILVIASIVGGKFVPLLTEKIIALQVKSIASTKLALIASKAANKQREKATKQHAKSTENISQKSLRKRIMAERKFLSKRKILHASFDKELINAKGKVNVKILNQQRAALARQEKAIIKGSGVQVGLPKDLVIIKQMIRDRALLTSTTQTLAIAEEKRSAQLAVHTTRMNKFTASIVAVTVATKSYVRAAASGLITGFSKSAIFTQKSLLNLIPAIKRAGLEWILYAKSVGTAASSTTLLTSAIGRSFGVLAGLGSKLLTIGLALGLAYTLLNFVWEIAGDRLRGITKEQRAVITAFEELGETLADITKRTKEFTAGFDKTTTTLSKFVADMEFVRGTLDSTLDSFRIFREQLALGLGTSRLNLLGLDFKAIGKEIEEIQGKIDDIQTRAKLGLFVRGRAIAPFKTIAADPAQQETLNHLKLSMIELNEKGETFRKIMKTVLLTTGPDLVDNFTAISKLLESQGFTQFSVNIKEELVGAFSQVTNQAGELFSLLEKGDTLAFFRALRQLNEGQQKSVLLAIADAVEDLGFKSLQAVNNFVASGRALIDINTNLGTFFSGIDKLRSASVPNKEQFNFLLDIRKNLKDLQTIAKEQGVEKRLGEVVNAKDLENIQKFIKITGDISLDDAVKRSQAALEPFEKLILKSLTKLNELKIIQLQLTTLKQEEIKSDERRLSIIDDIDVKTKERLNNQRDFAELQVAVLKENIRNLNEFKLENSIAITQEQGKLAVLEAQVIAYNAQIDVITESTKKAQEAIKIEKEKLTALQKQIGIFKQIAKIDAKASTGATESAKIARNVFNIELKLLDLKKKQLIQDKAKLIVRMLEGELLDRELLVLEAQLLLIEAQTRERERERLLRDARDAELSGSANPFNKEGADFIAKFFIRRLQEEATKLKGTFLIIGEGFANTMNNVFDTAVDNLLEGGKNFGRVVIEALKAGLRETFGEALKARIRDALNSLFNINTQQAQIKAMHEAKLASDASIVLGMATLEDAFRTFNLPGSSSGSSAAFLLPDIFDTGTDNTKGDALLKTGNQTAEDALTEIESGTQVAETIGQGAQKDSSNILGVLFAQLTQMISSTIATLFAADGGIIPGGTGPIRSLAHGSITNGPELALIGEGNRNEAIVPLPNNRSIPVELKGDTGGDTINIEQHFDFRNADAGTINQLRTEARAIEDRTFNRVFSEINRGGVYAKISGRR